MLPRSAAGRAIVKEVDTGIKTTVENDNERFVLIRKKTKEALLALSPAPSLGASHRDRALLGVPGAGVQQDFRGRRCHQRQRRPPHHRRHGHPDHQARRGQGRDQSVQHQGAGDQGRGPAGARVGERAEGATPRRPRRPPPLRPPGLRAAATPGRGRPSPMLDDLVVSPTPTSASAPAPAPALLRRRRRMEASAKPAATAASLLDDLILDDDDFAAAPPAATAATTAAPPAVGGNRHPR